MQSSNFTSVYLSLKDDIDNEKRIQKPVRLLNNEKEIIIMIIKKYN